MDFAGKNAPPLRVTARCEEEPWREALGHVAANAGCRVRVEENTILVYRPRTVSLRTLDEAFGEAPKRLVPENYTTLDLPDAAPPEAGF